jgi:hypothetical protein
MKTTEESRRKTREDLFGTEWAAIMNVQDDDDDIPEFDPIEDEEEF